MTTNPPNRILSIDALRGFDMLLIIFADRFFKGLHKGAQLDVTKTLAQQFDHPQWLGSTLYDIVMPLFLFIVGAVIPFALSKQKAELDNPSVLYPKLAKRFVLLFALGWLVQGNLLAFDWEKFVFFSNTLQAIAIGYLFSSLAYLHLKLKGRLLLFSACLIIYTLILTTVPVPEIGAGILEPNQNIALYFDKLVFGKHHDGSQYTWLLSSFGFIATTLSGLFAGELIKSKRPRHKVAINLVAIGLLSLSLGLLLGLWHPIIKKIWTSSFVLATSGVCYLLLALFYWIIDIKGKVKWAYPLRVIGKNAITAYVLSHVIKFHIIADFLLYGLEPMVGTYYRLVQSIGSFLILYLILWYMHKNRTFLKV